MRYIQTNQRLFFYLTTMALVFSGCAIEIKKPLRICPGKKSVNESLSTLRARRENIKPLKATGQCLLQYYTDTDKRKKESFFIRFWLNPPAEIYLQGDVALNPRGLILGSNREEFWLTIKHKEISSYWWGRWEEAKYVDELILSPTVVLEAFGVEAIDSQKQDEENWSLSNEGTFDVLTEYNTKGQIIKKVYIFCCDYSLNKIKYFDSYGQVAAIVELSKYRKLLEESSIPTKIKIIRYINTSQKDSVTITIRSVKQMRFSEKLRNHIFTLPKKRGFEHIFRVIEDKIIEQ